MRTRRILVEGMILATLAFSSCEPVLAQTSSNSILSSMTAYFTGFDSNKDAFAAHGLHVSTATTYVNGIGVSAELEADYQFGTEAQGKGFLIRETTDNAGIAGVILDQCVGVGYGVYYLDTRFSGGLDAGYRFDVSHVEGGIWGRAEKLATTNTGIFTEVEEKTEFGSGTKTPSIPTIKIGVFAKF